MGQGRRQFTDEFKREAVALLASSGRPLTQIASELGIAPSMLRNWRNRGGGQMRGQRCTRDRHRPRMLHRTRRQRSPGCAATTIACGRSVTF
jgi:transposase-like protein